MNIFLIITLLLWVLFVVESRQLKKVGSRPKILGGHPVDVTQYPYHVSLVWTYGKSYLCGGVIITSRHILTAAHCVRMSSGWDVEPTGIEVIAGRSFLIETGTVLPIKGIRIHPNYIIEDKHNDIAIIELQTPVKFSNRIRFVNITTEPLKSEQLCEAIGFGSTSFEEQAMSNELLHIRVPVLAQNQCKALYYNILTIHDGQLCAGYSTGKKDACLGDSGGPFICDGKLGAIISSGIKCGEPNQPGIYTNIDYYRPWIFSELNITSIEDLIHI